MRAERVSSFSVSFPGVVFPKALQCLLNSRHSINACCYINEPIQKSKLGNSKQFQAK